MPSRAFSLETSDGIPLSAWLIPHPSPKGVLILLHGYGACKADLLDLAQALHVSAPFHLVLFDFRGHGDSGGGQVSFGQREVEDVGAVLRWLSQEPFCRALPVGCWGLSMGGAVALFSAARYPEIQVLVIDSTYARLAPTIARTQWLTYHIPRVPLGQISLWAAEWRLGCRLRHLNPIDVVERIAPRPVLMIHGEADTGIPPGDGVALHRAAGDSGQLWLVPGAGHGSCFFVERTAYTKRIGRFFEDGFFRSTKTSPSF